MDIDEIIQDNLKEFGMFKEVGVKEKEYLKKVQLAIDEILERNNELYQELKKNRLSISKITEISNISRQTLYNYPLVKEYVEKYIEIYSEESDTAIIQRLKEEIKEKNDIINKMVYRDAELIDALEKLKEHEKEIISLTSSLEAEKNRSKLIMTNISKGD